MSPAQDSRREYSRAPARLIVHYGPDTPQGRRAVALDSELWAAQTGMEAAAREVLEEQRVSDELQPLLKVLHWLDFKVDMVLAQLRTRDLAEHFPHQAVTDTSGAGLGLAEGHGLEPGQRILVHLPLPDHPAKPVLAVAEVVRTRSEEGGECAGTALRFVEMADDDRELVIRFTFKKQRKHLARRAEGEQQ